MQNEKRKKSSKKQSKEPERLDFQKLKDIGMPTLGRKAFEIFTYTLIVFFIKLITNLDIFFNSTVWDLVVSGAIVLMVLSVLQSQRDHGEVKTKIKKIEVVEEKCEQCANSWQSLVAGNSQVISDQQKLLSIVMESDKVVRLQLNYYGLVVKANKQANQLFRLKDTQYPLDFVQTFVSPEEDQDSIRVKIHDFLADDQNLMELNLWLNVWKMDKKKEWYAVSKKFKALMIRVKSNKKVEKNEFAKLQETFYLAMFSDVMQVYELENNIETLACEYERILQWAEEELIPYTYVKQKRKLKKRGVKCGNCGHKWTDQTRLKCPHCDSLQVSPQVK